jgi:hypothetical protein
MQPLMQPDLVRSGNEQNPGRGAMRLAMVLAVWAAIVIVVCIRGLNNPRRNSVYPIFAGAARNFLAGADLYRTSYGPYRYSPLAAALLVPFSLSPDSVGGVLWRLLNVSVYFSALIWFSRKVLPVSLSPNQQAWLYLLIIPLSVGSLNNAQSNPLVLGLLLAGVSAVESQRWNLASGCVALACLFKVYPVAVGLLLAAIYPRRFAGRFVIALAAGLALPFVFKPSAYVLEQYADWFQHLQTDDRTQLPVELWYRDLRLLCHAFHVPLGPVTYLGLQLLAATGIAAICIWGRLGGWGQRRLLTLLISLACCWMTLFGPATESSTYILLAPTLAWTVLQAWMRPAPWWIRAGAAITLGLFTATQAAVWFPGGVRLGRALALHPLAGFVLLLCVVGMEVQESLCSKAAEIETGGFRPAEAA